MKKIFKEKKIDNCLFCTLISKHNHNIKYFKSKYIVIKQKNITSVIFYNNKLKFDSMEYKKLLSLLTFS
jgi:hypothetical protein